MSETATERPKETRGVRITLDIELDKLLDAEHLYKLRDMIVRTVEDAVPWVLTCQGTQIIPAEGNFDWQGK